MGPTRHSHPGPEDDEATQVGTFPMRVVSRLTGLNADTIRAWERRHRAIEPPRTEGNTRQFTRGDVERLVLLRDLVEHGHAIGQIAALPTEQLEALRDDERTRRPALVGAEPVDALTVLVNDYLEAIARFDARRGFDLLHQAAAHLPARDFIYRLALPILREVGARWSHAVIGVAQEHLATVQLRNILLTYQRLNPADRGAPRLIAATPAGHRHEFGLLIGALLAQVRGFDVLYLGVDVPDEELLWAARKSQAGTVLLAVAVELGAAEGARLAAMARSMPDKCVVWLGLPASDPFADPAIRRFTAFEQLEMALLERR